MRKSWLAALAVVVATGVLWAAVQLISLEDIYSLFPDGSRHPRFFTTCRSLRSLTLEDARVAMSSLSSFLEVGRTWHPPAPQEIVFQATVYGVPETAEEHASRIIFVPAANYSADWCIVHVQHGKIARVVVAPD